MIKRIYLAFMLISLSIATQAQSSLGELRGVAIDANTKEPLFGVIIAVEENGVYVTGGKTDFDGEYTIKGLRPGRYDVKAQLLSYSPLQFTDVSISPDKTTKQNFEMKVSTQTIDEVVVVRKARPPMVSKGDLSHSIDQVSKIPNRTINGIANTTSGLLSKDGGTPSFNGARSSATAYYIDGVRVVGSTNLPQTGIGVVTVITGGVPAEYGDFIGGAISISTPAPSSKTRGSIEGITSSLFDKYNYNQLDFSITGPLLTKNKGRGRDNGERTILGYSFAGNFNYTKDRSPSNIGVWKVKDEKLKELEENPLRPSTLGNNFVPAAEFVTMNDLEKVKANQNAGGYISAGIGNINYAPNDNIQIVLGLRYNYANVTNQTFANNLFNYNSNGQLIQNDVLSYLSFTQRLVTEDANSTKAKDKKGISNAYYTIRAEYQSTWVKQQDYVHKDRIFDYGYVGKFTTFSRPVFAYKGVNDGGKPDSFYYNDQVYYIKNYYDQVGRTDTAFKFDRSTTRNPIRSNYTSNYYDFVGADNIDNYFQIAGSNAGLVNGQSPIGIYSYMWNGVGANSSAYGYSQTEQYSMNASSEIQLNNHNFKFGIYYEQRVFRSYSVGATGLWTLMNQLQNNGLTMDRSNPELVFDQNGIFQDTVKYGYQQGANQSQFDKNMRAKLIERGATDVYGNKITNTSFIDINALDPNDMSLSLFSADELLNNGNSVVNYYGYDYLGNKTRGRKSVDDFLNDPQNRSIGAYSPIYTAAYIQDKFIFKDLEIRLGLRVERFDNNSFVLKDPYSLYPIRTAGEVKEINGSSVTHPGGIGNDYYVYVNSVENPTQILGYRDGNKWYNKDGTFLNDPSVIAENSSRGTIQPYLVDPNNKNLTSASFEDYTPIINVLPRLWFDFPINDDSRFFASYDIMAQRPSNQLITIDDYYYLPFRSTNIINNPNLKSQLTTDYSIGFKQRISDNSAITLVASYREQRNLIQLFRFNYTYPMQAYTSYGNIDFSTIKNFRLEYDLRDLGNFNINASYTLLYADGTGSNAASQQTLISSGQPNLRTLFPLDVDVRNNIKLNIYYDFANGDKYNGPTVGKKKSKIFENAGIGLNLNAFSGTPYTATNTALPDALRGVQNRSQIKGTPFGSRLPWQLQNDINIYKGKSVVLGRNKDGQKKYGQLKFSLWVQNFLNIKNINAVHSFTGSPTDDGYIQSSQGQQYIQGVTNQQAFIDLYNTALANPGYYSLPRRIRLSIQLLF